MPQSKTRSPSGKRSNKERVGEWRRRQGESGGRSLSVWLDPESARLFDEIIGTTGKKKVHILAEAIRALHSATCNFEDTVPPRAAATTAGGDGIEAGQRAAKMITCKKKRPPERPAASPSSPAGGDVTPGGTDATVTCNEGDEDSPSGEEPRGDDSLFSDEMQDVVADLPPREPEPPGPGEAPPEATESYDNASPEGEDEVDDVTRNAEATPDSILSSLTLAARMGKTFDAMEPQLRAYVAVSRGANYSYSEIIDNLSTSSIPSPDGGAWRRSHIFSLMK